MINRIILLLALVTGQIVYAQQDDCKVNHPGLSGTYGGGCKNGLAQGKGIAQGIDHYEGQFNKGKPEGKGIYTWADGTRYEGQWRDGLREGRGKMIFKDSVQSGYWQEDAYIGEKLVEPYNIITSRGVTRYSISKVSNSGTEVRIKLMQSGGDNLGIEDLSFSFDSGDEFSLGNTMGIQNVRFPIEVKLRYRSWNQLHTAQFEVTFEFAILLPGTWQVMITN